MMLTQGCSPDKNQKPEPEAGNCTPIKITAVGDFLMHMPLVKAAYDPASNKYNFKGMFNEVEKYLAAADFTIANLETRLAGPEKGYSGYPLFNTPAELAADMKSLGIDMVTTANNHSMDMGKPGVYKTLDNLDRAGLLHIGTYRSPQERERPFIVDLKGVKVGFLNYTQSTNGIPIPSGSPYLVNMIERKAINTEIQKLHAQKTDLIVACIHFGTEYQQVPNEFQRTLVKELFEQGVDVVLGNHVHVLQPMEVQQISINAQKKNCFVIYSLGNFISNQRWRHSDCGAIINIDIEKNHPKGTKITRIDYIPVWVHTFHKDNRLNFRVLPVDTAIKNYESGLDKLITVNDYHRLLQVKKDVTAILGPSINLMYKS